MKARLQRTLLAPIVTLGAVIALAGPAHAGPIDYGLNAHTPEFDAGANLNRQKALGNLPVRRLFIYWAMVQPNNSKTWKWDTFDRQYRSIVDAGLKPHLVLHGSPCWASPTTPCLGDTTHGYYASGLPSPNFTAQWTRFVDAAVKRYPATTSVDIWNEANLTGTNAKGEIDPVGYASLLKASYRTIKQSRRNLPVVSTGVSANLPGYGNWQTFLRTMLKSGAASSMDGLGLQIYPVDAVPGQLTWSANQFAPILDEANRIQAEFGANKPLWITESGCGSTVDHPVWRAITAEQQATDCVSMLEQAAARGDVRAMYVHTLDDVPLEWGWGWPWALGVYNSDGSPKPVACAISTLLDGSLQC